MWQPARTLESLRLVGAEQAGKKDNLIQGPIGEMFRKGNSK